MTFTSDADEIFYCLHRLDQKSDILNLLAMAAYVVRADAVVAWYNARATEFWGRGAHALYHGWLTHGAL